MKSNPRHLLQSSVHLEESSLCSVYITDIHLMVDLEVRQTEALSMARIVLGVQPGAGCYWPRPDYVGTYGEMDM